MNQDGQDFPNSLSSVQIYWRFRCSCVDHSKLTHSVICTLDNLKFKELQILMSAYSNMEPSLFWQVGRNFNVKMKSFVKTISNLEMKKRWKNESETKRDENRGYDLSWHKVGFIWLILHVQIQLPCMPPQNLINNDWWKVMACQKIAII